MTRIRTQFHDLLAQTAEATPGRPALTYKDRTVTYAQVWELTRAVGAQFAGLGLGRGDRVAIYLEKRLETVAAIFAASVVGGIFVPINHILKPPQVGHILRDSGARVLVTSADRLAQLAGVLADTDIADVIVVDTPGTAAPDGIAVHPWPDADADADAAAGIPAPTTIDVDPAAILYTSGSTGKPKGVVLSHRNLIVGAESV
ncbi:MAG: AMP-binding protein, partial [Microbacteriaceae bacterium]